MFSNFPKKYM